MFLEYPALVAQALLLIRCGFLMRIGAEPSPVSLSRHRLPGSLVERPSRQLSLSADRSAGRDLRTCRRRQARTMPREPQR